MNAEQSRGASTRCACACRIYEGVRSCRTRQFRSCFTRVEQLRLAQEELRDQSEALEAAHDELLEERRRYQHLFQYAPDAYLLTDLSGIVREANLSAARLLNIRP